MASTPPVLSGGISTPYLFKWTTLKRIAIDVLNLSVAGLLSFSQKRARKSPVREIWRLFFFLNEFHIFFSVLKHLEFYSSI